MTKFLSRAEAAEHLTSRGLPITRLTLQKMATTGGGPLYRRFGTRAVYEAEHLDAWAAAKMGAPLHSTSERSAAAE